MQARLIGDRTPINSWPIPTPTLPLKGRELGLTQATLKRRVKIYNPSELQGDGKYDSSPFKGEVRRGMG